MSEAAVTTFPYPGITPFPLEAARMNVEEQQHTSYEHNRVFTASREELVLMLYDGATKFIRRGMQALEAQDVPASRYNLLRAQKIVRYLDLSLDLQQGREIAQNLARLYDFVNQRLSSSLLSQTREPAQEALRIVDLLRQSWSQGLVHPSQAGA